MPEQHPPRFGALLKTTPEQLSLRMKITIASADPSAADIRHCTVMVNTLLVMPFRVAVTLVVEPEVAVELTAPLPLAMVAITAVLLLVQLTRLVMSCCVELPLISSHRSENNGLTRGWIGSGGVDRDGGQRASIYCNRRSSGERA